MDSFASGTSISQIPKMKLKIDGPFSTLRRSKVPINSMQLEDHHNLSLEILELKEGGGSA